MHSSDEDETTDGDYSENSNGDDRPWISKFITTFAKGYLLCVPEEFYDEFNLCNLPHKPASKRQMDIIMGKDSFKRMDSPGLKTDTVLLYLGVHQRYVQSEEGMKKILEMVKSGLYGMCPRIGCSGSPLIPTGCSCKEGVSPITLYCPCCMDLYNPKDPALGEIDGVAFGASFGPFLQSSFPSEFSAYKFQNTKLTLFGKAIPECERRICRGRG